LYTQGQASNRIQQLFVEQVESIHWQYKLSSSTVNMQDEEDFKEIQIFSIVSRVPELSLDVLKYIDHIILSPIVFEIAYKGRLKVVAAYKRLNQVDKTKVVLGNYYASDWIAVDSNRIKLPIYLKLKQLYEHFIEQLLPSYGNNKRKVFLELQEEEHFGHEVAVPTGPFNVVEQESISLEDKLKRVEEIERVQRQIKRLKAALTRERQFNKKVAINQQIKSLEKQILEI
jgi:hypothetical protein